MQLVYLLLLVSVAAAARSGPYPPSGWRPSGPAFLLPTEKKNAPETENAVAADTNIQSSFNPPNEYGAPIPEEPTVAPEDAPSDFANYAKAADLLLSRSGNPEEVAPDASTPSAEIPSTPSESSTPENIDASTPDSSNPESIPSDASTPASIPNESETPENVEPELRSAEPNAAAAAGQGFEEYGPPKEDQPQSPLEPKFGEDAPAPEQNQEAEPSVYSVQSLPDETTGRPFVSSDCSNGDCSAQPKTAPSCEGSDCESQSTPAPDCLNGADCGAPSTAVPSCEGSDCESQSTPAPDCGNGADCGAPSTPAPDCVNGADCGAPSTPAPLCEGSDCAQSTPVPDCVENDCGTPSTSAPSCEGDKCGESTPACGDDCTKVEQSTPVPNCGADCEKSESTPSSCTGEYCGDTLQAKFNEDEAKNDVENAGDLSQVEDGKAPDEQFKNEPFANNEPAGFAEYGPPKEDAKPSVEDARRRRFSPKFKFTVRNN